MLWKKLKQKLNPLNNVEKKKQGQKKIKNYTEIREYYLGGCREEDTGYKKRDDDIYRKG